MAEKKLIEEIEKKSSVIYQGKPMMTNEDVADFYKVGITTITSGIHRKKNFFKKGSDYLTLTGEELYSFKNSNNNVGLVGKRAKIFFLWFPTGVIKQGRIIYNKESWKVFSMMLDDYLNT